MLSGVLVQTRMERVMATVTTVSTAAKKSDSQTALAV